MKQHKNQIKKGEREPKDNVDNNIREEPTSILACSVIKSSKTSINCELYSLINDL
jgi:hypothetical protein